MQFSLYFSHRLRQLVEQIRADIEDYQSLLNTYTASLSAGAADTSSLEEQLYKAAHNAIGKTEELKERERERQRRRAQRAAVEHAVQRPSVATEERALHLRNMHTRQQGGCRGGSQRAVVSDTRRVGARALRVEEPRLRARPRAAAAVGGVCERGVAAGVGT